MPAWACFRSAVYSAALFLPFSLSAQSVSPASPGAGAAAEEEVVTLSPFTVDVTQDTGYAATSTLAGTRLRTNLEDVGTSITVLTKEFLDDIGGTDSGTALAYATNAEVASVRGNLTAAGSGSFGNNDETIRMLNPSTSTRVRGLVGADNTRSYFRTTVGWDGFNVGRIDMLRGPNSILFGLGSPGGIINASTDMADLRRDRGELGLAMDQFGSARATFKYNKVLVRDQLAVRVAALMERQNFRQEYTFEDKDRQFITATYRPKQLNRNGMTFDVSVDYEQGETKSNRPRFTPPVDLVTPFKGQLVINPIQLPAGTNFRNFPGGVIPGYTYALNGFIVPYASNFGNTLQPGLQTSFDANGVRFTQDFRNSIGQWVIPRGGAYGVRNPNGTINTNPQSAALFSANYGERKIEPLNVFATQSGHPFANAFTPNSLTDSSVFDFYNQLLDGPNKREWSDFDQFRAVLATTFFNQKVGFEASHYKENSEYGQTTLLSDNARIMVDINGFRQDGSPNPNVGRAYVQETTFSGNRIRTAELEATRLSGYLDYDFVRENKGAGWLQWVLGRNLINAVWSEDQIETFNRDYQRHVYPDDLMLAIGRPNQRFTGDTRTGVQYYISDDLRNVTSLAGANFSPVVTPILEGLARNPISVRVFDPTWIAPAGVANNALWVNPLGANSTQSANPANYVGWVNRNYQLIDALSGNQADLDLATRNATIARNKVESEIISWQGYLFGNAVVGTVGWRQDVSISNEKRSTSRPDQGANLDPAVFNYGTGTRNELKTESKNYSVVTHLNRLPGMDGLPLNVALGYNQGQNFSPSAGRVDRFGIPLAPPEGTTEEYSVALSTKDRRYSLKVTQYETKVLNASTGAIANEFRFQQLLGNVGAVSAYEIATGVLRNAYQARPVQPTWSIEAQEQVHAPAWYAFESALKAAFPTFVSSWNNAGPFAPSNNLTRFGIAGTNTADTVSKGYEIEFTANPTRGLRLTFNASKTEAVSDNVPGPAGTELYEFVHRSLVNPDGSFTAAGQMRNRNDAFGTFEPTMGQFWLNNMWPEYLVVLQRNGQRNTELVEWRFNFVGNYTFEEGRLKGFGLGGAYRWEGERSIGYPRYFDASGAVKADIDNPWMAPSNDRVDLNFSYRRKLTAKIDWRVQLNVFNAFGSNKLIPVTANPDGSYGLMRIQEGRSWRIANTFSF
jgi:outer membrane receptor protein involved in Fe transport